MNHFIELGRSVNDGRLHLTIHTGSRQFGKCIGEYWQKLPVTNKYKNVDKKFQEGLAKIKAEAHTKELRKEIPNKIRQLKAKLGMNNKALKAKDLDYIEGEDAQGYLTDMLFAAVYASINRIEIATSISSLGVMMDFDHAIESVHNFIDYDDFVIRKGAIRAYTGEKMIIPFNMEDGILVCEGKSNPEWNFSAPHGAGRVLSRGQAKRVLGDSLVAAKRMKNKGIYASIIPVDETKESYKDPAVIERHIEPTATIIDRIKPILTIKGGKID